MSVHDQWQLKKINENQSHVPLAPSNLPMVRPEVVMLPSGSFGLADTYYPKC